MGTDWVAWHEPYADPASWRSQRLAVVRRLLAGALDAAPTGRISLVSLCAGQGHDVLGVLPDHPRRRDVRARLVEADAANVAAARRRATEVGMTDDELEVVRGDAGTTDACAGRAPVDVLLLCGIFGNVVNDDIRRTIGSLPTLVAAGATVLWTRYPRDAELLPTIDGWFVDAGFERLAVETGADGTGYGVGAHRFAGEPRPFASGTRLFTFLDEPDPAGLRRRS